MRPAGAADPEQACKPSSNPSAQGLAWLGGRNGVEVEERGEMLSGGVGNGLGRCPHGQLRTPFSREVHGIDASRCSLCGCAVVWPNCREWRHAFGRKRHAPSLVSPFFLAYSACKVSVESVTFCSLGRGSLLRADSNRLPTRGEHSHYYTMASGWMPTCVCSSPGRRSEQPAPAAACPRLHNFRKERE